MSNTYAHCALFGIAFLFRGSMSNKLMNNQFGCNINDIRSVKDGKESLRTFSYASTRDLRIL